MARIKSIIKWSAPGIAMVLAVAPFAQTFAQEGAPAAGNPANGKHLFEVAVCGACHTLADAGTNGPIGPSFDHNPNLSREHIIDVVSNGSGAMPPYSGQFSEAEIDDLAAYLLSASVKD